MVTDAQAEPTARKPNRRWLQFSISSLLLLMLVCAVGLALIVGPAERQRRAVKFAESLGGRVWYADEGDESHRAPSWLREMLGDDYFQSVSAVSFNTREATDAVLVKLKGLTTLKYLDLSDTQVGDAGMVHLKGLVELKCLYLGGTQVSDAGMVHLKELTKLTSLSLRDTRVGDAGLTHLKLTELKQLHLGGTYVSDAKLAELQQALAGCDILH